MFGAARVCQTLRIMKRCLFNETIATQVTFRQAHRLTCKSFVALNFQATSVFIKMYPEAYKFLSKASSHSVIFYNTLQES